MEEKYKDDFASPYEFSKEQQPGFCKPCRDHMKTAGERWCTTCKTWGQDPKTKGSWADGKAWLRTKYCAACPTDKSASKARKMADSPAHQKHNAAQKRSAAEMAATEERMRCRTCEKLLPRDKFSSSQLHDSVALERRCRGCAAKYDNKTRRNHNQEMAVQCAKCDKSVQAHAEHITKNQKDNARKHGTKILCPECVAKGFTVLNLQEYTCTINKCQYGRNAFVTNAGGKHTRQSFADARRRGTLVCTFCHDATKP
jgi:hypothetical protein